VLAARDHEPQGPPASGRHLDGAGRPGQLGGEHALGILVAERLGQRDHQAGDVAGEPGGSGRVGQPAGQAGNDLGSANPLRRERQR